VFALVVSLVLVSDTFIPTTHEPLHQRSTSILLFRRKRAGRATYEISRKQVYYLVPENVGKHTIDHSTFHLHIFTSSRPHWDQGSESRVRQPSTSSCRGFGFTFETEAGAVYPLSTSKTPKNHIIKRRVSPSEPPAGVHPRTSSVSPGLASPRRA